MINISKDIGIVLIKCLDIGYIYTIYFILAFLTSIALDILLGQFVPDPNLSIIILTLEVIGIFWLVGLIMYFTHYLVSTIPFPLNGYLEFNHTEFHDYISWFLFSYILLTCTENIQNRLIYLYNRIRGIPTPPAFPSKKLKG